MTPSRQNIPDFIMFCFILYTVLSSINFKDIIQSLKIYQHLLKKYLTF